MKVRGNMVHGGIPCYRQQLMWFTCVMFTAVFWITECKGVLRAGADDRAEEEPGVAGVYQAAGEQDASPRKQLQTCEGIFPGSGSAHLLSLLFQFLSMLSAVRPVCSSSPHLTFSLKGSFSAGMIGSYTTTNPLGRPNLSHSHVSGYNPLSTFSPASSSPEAGWQGKSQSSASLGSLGKTQQEVQDLKEQLEARRCQVGYSCHHSIKKFFIMSNVMRTELISSHCCRVKDSLNT